MMLERDKDRWVLQGQAMAEFVIILFLVMILASGMLYASRLLTFHFWAQQEARYVAFEQTWSAEMHYQDTDAPIENLENSSLFRRPLVIDRLDSDKSIEGDGDLSGLLAYAEDELIDESEPVKQVASLWQTRSSAWLDRFHFIQEAYASLNSSENTSRQSLVIPSEGPLPQSQEIGDAVESLVEKILFRGNFGGKFCTALARLAKGHEQTLIESQMSGKTCAQRQTESFAQHFGKTFNMSDAFVNYADKLEFGFEPGLALENTVREIVANQYFSWFDSRVRNAFPAAPSTVEDGFTEISLELLSGMVLNEGEYIGSLIAMGVFSDEILSIAGSSSGNQNWQVEKQLEDEMNEVLLADASDPLSWGAWSELADGFSLDLEYLPLASIALKPMMGNLFESLGRNIFDQEEGLHDLLIDESNKVARIDYDAEAGLFSAARRRFRTSNRRLTSRFYLITQPWHITRRESAFGPFRGVGGEEDSTSAITEEGMLRRRGFGLYLVPSRMFELLTPMTDLVPGLDNLNGVFQGVDSVLSEVKEFVLGDVLNSIRDALRVLDSLLGIDFVPPEFPPVHPLVYPDTEELVGDRSAGEARNFQDFVDEQVDGIRFEPDPEFDD